VPTGTVLAGAQLAAFRAQKAHIDHLVNSGEAAQAAKDDKSETRKLAAADTDPIKVAGLRR